MERLTKTFVLFGRNCLVKSAEDRLSTTLQQVRSLQLWADWRMKKDVRKRKALEDNYELKLRYNAMRRSNILPPEIKELVTADFHKNLPNDVKMNKIIPRCALTSRPRGNVVRWRLSRIMFRHLSDYNKMAGIQRAMW
ncbi:28S ribosomal protein S14, mitochondrial [Macrosteles quadrilineatus]|uniref:28S ribosomal protein S14, mitochondrial n=1 Tax=Macrosteles quadrilineatus TaxID=74068 RepID=UPI0023E0B48E|nr:28S ribosomal protein S14, mitochondrial [Macrosteles quadrilineatus]